MTPTTAGVCFMATTTGNKPATRHGICWVSMDQTAIMIKQRWTRILQIRLPLRTRLIGSPTLSKRRTSQRKSSSKGPVSGVLDAMAETWSNTTCWSFWSEAEGFGCTHCSIALVREETNARAVVFAQNCPLGPICEKLRP